MDEGATRLDDEIPRGLASGLPHGGQFLGTDTADLKGINIKRSERREVRQRLINNQVKVKRAHHLRLLLQQGAALGLVQVGTVNFAESGVVAATTGGAVAVCDGLVDKVLEALVRLARLTGEEETGGGDVGHVVVEDGLEHEEAAHEGAGDAGGEGGDAETVADFAHVDSGA